ncbi:DUF4252 domain-containing protein [Hymenobacter sp. HD11105]
MPIKLRLLSLLAVLALTFTVSCRTSGPESPARTVAEFFRKYENRSGFKATTLSAGFTTRLLLARLGKMGGNNDLAQALTSVREIRMLTFTPTTDRAQRLVAAGLNREVDGLLASERYTPLPVSTDSASTTINRYAVRQQGDKVQELVATGNVEAVPESFALVAISGNFTHAQVDQLVKFLPGAIGELSQLSQ